MNSLDHSWFQLTAAARRAAADEAVPAPDPAWVTRVAALGAAVVRQYRALPAWLAWAVPGFGVAAAIAVAVTLGMQGSVATPNDSAQLVALADPLAGGALFP